MLFRQGEHGAQADSPLPVSRGVEGAPFLLHLVRLAVGPGAGERQAGVTELCMDRH